MSVLVKGMEMPKRCLTCQFHGFGGYKNELIVCSLTGWSEGQLSNVRGCPLIEVPTPHGRLIDADELYEVISLNFKDLDSTEDFMGIGYDHCIADTLVVLRQASTIIEAEEEEDDSLKVQSR